MAGITQHKQKYLIFIAVPQGRKKLTKLEQKKVYSTSNQFFF